MGIRAFNIPSLYTGGNGQTTTRTRIVFEGDEAAPFMDAGVGAVVSGSFEGPVQELALADEMLPQRAVVDATVNPNVERPGMNELIARAMRTSPSG